MRILRITCAIAIVGLLGVATASAAEPGSNISHGRLASMGLGSLTAVSDAQGMTVRGQGVSGFVFGKTFFKPLNPNVAAGRELQVSGRTFSFGAAVAAAR